MRRWWAAGAVALLLTACSAAADQARSLAAEACTLTGPETPNFDADVADYELLLTLAEVAQERADRAQRAADQDARWQVLADATALLAVSASRIEEVRRTGGTVSEEVPAAVWDQIKYASDALVVECRAALRGEPTLN
jgi:ribosome-binding ATPase YchF (GTP1/OBG family)